MRKALALSIMPIIWLGTSGCGLVPFQPVEKDTTTWARLGTPSRILDDRILTLEVPMESGWKKTSGSLKGMMSLDEPTYEIYKAAYEREKSAKAK